MRLSSLTFNVLAALVVSACADATSEVGGSSTERAEAVIETPRLPETPDERPLVEVPLGARFSASGAYILDPSLPLAYRQAPRLRALGDEFDEVRADAPQNYAITKPPARIATVRPMVEWEPMKALVLAFPGYAAEYAATSKTFVDIALSAVDHGQVWIIVDTAQAENFLKNKLAQRGLSALRMQADVKFVRQQIDAYWLIDSGPLPLVDVASGTWAVGDFRYYHERALDDSIPTVFARNGLRFGELVKPTTYRMPLSTEGGTFQATTEGVCFTSSRQIYNMSCEAGNCRESILGLSLVALQEHQYTVEMETVLRTYAGCKDLVVTHSITDDGTGHIDMYLKVLDDDRILMGDYRRPYQNDYQEENGRLLDDNAAFLEAYLRPNGETFEVHRMPMPGHRLIEDFFGEYEVPFTYLNSTFFNGVNLWPAYNFPEWEESRNEAQAIWEQLLPDVVHVWIDAEELSYQSGAIHCVTRTIPDLPAGQWVDDGACEEGVCVPVEGETAESGYDGVCSVDASGGNLCWGPDWLCGCNDCRECPVEVPEIGCNGVSWRGCCEDGDVLYCENAILKRLPCGGLGCGWDAAQGYYGCGLEGADPSGQTAQICVCEPQCEGRSCGADGCGGSCGACDEAAICVEGVCRTDCASCEPGEARCEGAVSVLCVAGAEGCHALQRVDCAASGLACESGDCVSVPAEEVEPGPEAIEPGPEAIEPGPTDDADVGGEDAVAEVEEPAPARKKSGCGGAEGSALGLMVLMVGLAGRRRGR
jgi:agmatine/peptidylarginine deiminase